MVADTRIQYLQTINVDYLLTFYLTRSLQICSDKGVAVSVMDKDHLSMCLNIEEFEIVMFVDFSSIDDYIGILTKMARHSIDGALHIFLNKVDVLSAGPLIKVLEQCSQPVPETIKNCLNPSSSVLEP